MNVQLIYISTPTSDALIDEGFIRDSQSRNKKHGINSIIITSPKFYIQLLEGERVAVNRLYSNILKNDRHRDVLILRYVEVKSKEFTDWSMVHLSEDDLVNEVIATSKLSSRMLPSDMSGVEALALLRRVAAVLRVKKNGGDVPSSISNILNPQNMNISF